MALAAPAREVPVLKAVAFDMDDTLLSINLSAFIAVMAFDESRLLADIARRNPLSAFAAYTGAVLELNGNAVEDGDASTNRERFERSIERRLGVPLSDPVVADVFEYYEREVMPGKNDAVIAARPKRGARAAIDAVLSRGLKIALLTNPCFSQACIECRMGWGGLSDVPFERVSTWDNSTRCKPSTTYYLEHLDAMGLEPQEVLMVGNDSRRDFPAPDCGLQTAYIGAMRPVRATWSGSIEDFADSFDEIEERFYERQERDLVDIVQDVDRR